MRDQHLTCKCKSAAEYKKLLIFNIDKNNFKYITTRLCFYSVDSKPKVLS